MIASAGVVPPEPRELRACALAALAEAGVLALPVWLVLTETRGLEIGVGTLVVPFVAAYVAGALLACRLRASPNVPFVAVAFAVLAGIWLGHADLNRTVFAIVVCLLVGLRLVMLALRDWRVPIEAEFGWFAVALGFEVLIASDATTEWRGALVVIVPLFFVFALASRASTVWTTAGAGELDDRVRSAWIRRAMLATGALLVAMASAVALSIEGGVFDRIGAWLTPAANGLATLLAWTLSQIARPIFWLVDRLGIDPDRVRELLESLRRGAAGRASDQAGGGPSLWQRMLGFLVFAALGYALFRVLRRFRPPVGAEPEPRVPPGSTESRAELLEPAPSRASLRREPPADAVRRWYGETLDALARREIVKDPWQTPSEFAPVVAEAVPACADDFRELTRAYEDVRYGSLRLDRSALHRLETGQRRIGAALGFR